MKNDSSVTITPIEGRPEMKDIDWELQYINERKSRMTDCIDEYLQDPKTDARQTYEDILSCIDGVIQYHKKEYDKAVALKSLMLGERNPATSD